ncbi:MAG: GlxA family transcriptional regulator [Pseudomonadota bacterium]
MTKTAILVLHSTNTLSLAAAVDPLRAANRQAGRAVFDWQFVTPDDRPVTLTSGLAVSAAPVHKVASCDLLIIVAGFDLQAQSTPRLHASLRRLAGGAQRILAIDGGPWIAAAAGLLDGQRATTHWEDLGPFADTFAEVETVNARYVTSGPCWTSGGAAPALDMMLHMLRDHLGASLARKVAASFIHTSQPAPTDPQLRHLAQAPRSGIAARAHAVMEAHIDTPLPLPEIARRLGLSPRSLQLHFKRSTGCSAKSHYRALRLTEAKRLIQNTNLPISQIALATGFATPSSLSRAYTQAYGTPPSTTRP